ncbi:MAG TPA: PIG-L family deacetylase [Rhodothermales bacterium]|nr:PIG-L family deacetylase [Rhodothermales bacterium]
MGRILYVFPHPDDEAFGPGPVLARQRRQGHEVSLLTLTRGEATRQRTKFGFSKAEMGQVRYEEMQCTARVLDLNSMTVLEFPDGGLPELDPAVLADAIRTCVEGIRPEVVVTYPVHGISGHPDHLAGHAVVKQVFCDLRRDGAGYLKRLAFFTLSTRPKPGRPGHLKGSPREAIDCIVPIEKADMDTGRELLQCYKTYQAVVSEHNPLAQVEDGVAFEFFQEDFTPPVDDLFAELDAA